MITSDAQETEIGLQGIEAYFGYLRDGPEKALSDLEGMLDPDSVTSRLDILLDSGRTEEAAVFLEGIPPHALWVDRAVRVFVLTDQRDQAKGFVRWAKGLEDLSAWRRSVLAFANAILENVRSSHDETGPLAPSTLRESDRSDLEDALQELRPIIHVVQANERVSNRLEAEGAETALLTSYLLGRPQEVQALARVLETYRPVSLVLATIAQWHGVEPALELPQRLRTEHPDSFGAALLAAVLENEAFGRPGDAFEHALELRGRASTEEEREQLLKVLMACAQHLGPEAGQELREAIAFLNRGSSPWWKLYKASEYLQAGATADAATALNEICEQGTPEWLQLQAELELRRGDKVAATDHLLEACKVLKTPLLLERTAEIAFFCKRYQDAARVLEELLQHRPDDVACHMNAALTHTGLGDFGKAAEHFARLRQLQPEKPAHVINHAIALARAGRPEDALRALECLSHVEGLPAEPFVVRAGILQTLGKARDAFEVLSAVKAEYWDHPQFVQAMLSVGYAAGEDAAADAALRRLLELQQQSKPEKPFLEHKSVDDFAAMMKKEHEARRKLLDGIGRGRLPWLSVDIRNGTPSYTAWYVRTQEMANYPEALLDRAQFCTYATNAFAFPREHDGALRVEGLACAPRGSQVVADLTALITLHRLGYLGAAADYFGQILLPSIYSTLRLGEGPKLQPHQRSRRDFVNTIRSYVEQGRIAVLQDAKSENEHKLSVIDEYSDEPNEPVPRYGLRDVAAALTAAGQLADDKRVSLLAASRKLVMAPDTAPRLKRGDEVIIDLHTLQTLSYFELLDPVVGVFRVSLAEQAYQALLREVQEFAIMQEVYGWHEDMWRRIVADDGFIFTPLSDAERGRAGEAANDNALVAIALARDRKLPLLAEDRVLQMVVCNEGTWDTPPAFSTSHLLIAMKDEGLLSVREAADAFLQLIRWRYRFLLPPAEVLKDCADRYRESPPGSDLRTISRYVHDCMRDPGLPVSPERTEAPTSVASRLFQRWSHLTGEFVMCVWSDETFPEQQAEELTSWALRELLPSIPRRMGRYGTLMAGACTKSAIAGALLQAVSAPQPERVNRGLICMKKALRLTDDEYERTVAEVIDIARD